MVDVPPLTGEEIVTLRKILGHRAKFIAALWASLGTLVAGVIFAAFFD